MIAARRALSCFLLMGVLAAGPLACKRTSSPPATPEAAAAALEQATGLARGMLRYDLIAWWATDALLAKGGDAAALRGWLVAPGQSGVGDAAMLGVLPGGEVGVIASVRCDVGAGPSACVVDPEFAARPLSAEERTMQRAIKTAKADRFFVESQRHYNTIVLRAADHGVDAGWIVYIVASTTDPEVVPVGRHFRFDVSRDGGRVLRRRASHRSVLELSRRPPGIPEAGEVVMLSTSAVFDAMPTEFQLYVSSLWEMPLGMSGCDGSLWSIEGLKVRQLRPLAARARCPDPWREK